MAFLSTSEASAIARLKAGKLVALPTETVYGLAADAGNAAAVEAVFALKGRPAHNPLIVHVSDVAMAQRYGQWNAMAEALAAQYWPGPLTLVLPKLADCLIAPDVTAGGQTIALRAPAHPLMRKVIDGLGRGIAAPSANRSGRISPTQAAHVLAEFPEADLMVMDGGVCSVGLESTVVDCTGEAAQLLRPGSIDVDARQQAHRSVQKFTEEKLKSPGQLASHYAPSLPVRLEALDVAPDEALLAFGRNAPSGGAAQLNLSERADISEAAANLYAMLRQLDSPAHAGIAVMPIAADTALGAAINDRLKRAAAPRED